MADRHSGSARLVIGGAIGIDCYSLFFKSRPGPGALSVAATRLPLECDGRAPEEVTQPAPEGIRPVPGRGMGLGGAGEIEGGYESGSGEDAANGSSSHGTLSPSAER